MKEIKMFGNKIALVDNLDFESVNKYLWHCTSHGYVARNLPRKEKRRVLYLHRLIMNAQKGQQVDHRNRNKLDNRRENLRFCTSLQNEGNSGKKGGNSSSQYKGVYFNKQCRKWVAQIRTRGRTVSLGLFQTEHQAVLVYDLWAIDVFGEFANPNFQPIAHS